MSIHPNDEVAREKEIFLGALDIEDPEERGRFLEQECGNDEELRQGVESLLGLVGAADELFEEHRYRSLEAERSSVGRELSAEYEFLDRLGSGIGRLGDYELLEEVGRGAMGVVFRARQVGLNRDVALKIVLNAALASEAERQRFRVEAEAAARLEHPNIVPVYEIGSHEGHDYFSMALVRGGTLGDLMRDEQLAPREAVELFLPVVEAVAAAHDRGVIHRDLKPDNILLTPERVPMVSDFGLACRVDREIELTLTGQVMGTPRYLAPELAMGKGTASMQSDLYALGAILYELLAGEPAFGSTSILATLRMIHEEVPTSLRSRAPQVDRDLETVVLTCLEKDPKRRYPSVRTLADELVAWLEGRPIAARAPGTLERIVKWVRRRPIHAALAFTAALFLLTLGIGGPLAAWQQRKLREDAEAATRSAEVARREAVDAAELARLRADANRRLAYSASQRYIQLFHELGGKRTLGSEAMITGWTPAPGGEDLRGWEWYFNNGRIKRKIKSFHIGNTVNSVAFTPFGKRIAASGPRGTQIRNTLTSALVRVFADASGHRRSVWSPDGTRLATVNGEGVVEIWNPADGSKRSAFSGHDDCLDFTWGPSHLMVTLHPDGLRRWEGSESGDFVLRQHAPTGGLELHTIALSPEGSHLAAIGPSPTLYLWETAALDQAPAIYDGASGELNSLAWVANGKWVSASTDRGRVRVWGVPGGQRVLNYDTNDGAPAVALAWNPDGTQLILSDSLDRSIHLVDFLTLKHRKIANFSKLPVALAWNVNAHSIAIGTKEGEVNLFRHGLPDAEVTLLKHSTPLRALTWTDHGRFLSCLSAGDDLFRVDPVALPREVPDPIRVELGDGCVAWNPDSGALAIAPDGGRHVRILARDRESEGDQELPLPIRDTAALVWLPDGDLLACGGHGELARMAPDGSHPDGPDFERPPSVPGHRYQAFSRSPDGLHLLGTDDGRRHTHWSISDGGIARDWRGPEGEGGGRVHTWRPDSEVFATANDSGALTLWKLGSEVPLRRIEAHRGPIRALAWHPDGERLASAGRDGQIRLWDPENGELLLSLRGHKGEIRDLAWDPDGRRLASCGIDGTLRLWDATAGMIAAGE